MRSYFRSISLGLCLFSAGACAQGNTVPSASDMDRCFEQELNPECIQVMRGYVSSHGVPIDPASNEMTRQSAQLIAANAVIRWMNPIVELGQSEATSRSQSQENAAETVDSVKPRYHQRVFSHAMSKDTVSEAVSTVPEP